MAPGWLKKLFQEGPSDGDGDKRSKRPRRGKESFPAAKPESDAPSSGGSATGVSVPWWERPEQLLEVGDRPVLAADPEEQQGIAKVSSRLESGQYQLPVLSSTLVKVIEFASQPDPDVKAIAESIRTDPAVTGEVLSLVNSAAYAAAAPI